MKVLILNPSAGTAQEIARHLKKCRVAVLVPENATDAWQMLQMHGRSVDLAVIHREGAESRGEPGLELIQKIKADRVQGDLPIILTTGVWSEQECAVHQGGAKTAANAYLKCPFTGAQVVEMIEKVTGQALVAPENTGVDLSVGPDEITSIKIAPLGEREREATGVHQSSADHIEEEKTSMAANGEIVLNFGDAEPAEAPPAAAVKDDHTQVASVSQIIQLGDRQNSKESGPKAPSIPIEGLEFASEVPDDGSVDLEANQEMPYLFGGSQPSAAPQDTRPKIDMGQAFGVAFGDAIVPGGAANSPDVETLKKYLLLREQDVIALSAQLKTAHDQVRKLDETVKMEKARNTELSHMVKEQASKLDHGEKESQVAGESRDTEIAELKFELKTKHDKVRVLELKIHETLEVMENLKERVRVDIRKIRVREKELENKLEVVKRDSESLIASRENKILELKRKLDLLEFNMDLLQERYSREKDHSFKLREKLFKVSQAMKVAGGLIEEPGAEKSAERPIASTDAVDVERDAS